MGANPRDDENLTAQQHFAFKCIVRDLDHICVDFAVWGPHGDRMLKQRCFVGLGFGPDGKLMKLEIRGPPRPSIGISAIGYFVLVLLVTSSFRQSD